MTLIVPVLVRSTGPLPPPRAKVPAPVLLSTPLLLRLRLPVAPKFWLMPLPDKLRVPALLIALVPGSSSIPPVTLTVPPSRMPRVRPPKLLPALLPDSVRSAPPATTTAPPPVQAPLAPLQVLPVPLSVSTPLPDKVPPVCVRLTALTGALAVNVPPERFTAFTLSGPPIASDPLLTASVLFTCVALLPKVRMPPLICNRSWLDTAAAACDPVFTVMVWAPARSGINAAWPAVGVPRLQLVDVPQSSPTGLIQVLTVSMPETLSVTLLAL